MRRPAIVANPDALAWRPQLESVLPCLGPERPSLIDDATVPEEFSEVRCQRRPVSLMLRGHSFQVSPYDLRRRNRSGRVPALEPLRDSQQTNDTRDNVPRHLFREAPRVRRKLARADEPKPGRLQVTRGPVKDGLRDGGRRKPVTVLSDRPAHCVGQRLPGPTDGRLVRAIPRRIAFACRNRRTWPGRIHACLQQRPLGVVNQCRPRKGFSFAFRRGNHRKIRGVGGSKALQSKLVEQLATARAQPLCVLKIVAAESATQECAQSRHGVLPPVKQLPDDLSDLVAEVVECNPGGDARRIVPAVGEDNRSRLRCLGPEATKQLGHSHLVELRSTRSMCADRRANIAGEVHRRIAVILTPAAAWASFRQRGQRPFTINARSVVAENDCWDTFGRVPENEQAELGIPRRGPEVGLDSRLILIHVGGKLMPGRRVRNRRAKPEPSILVIIPSIHEVARVLTRGDRRGRQHDCGAIRSINNVATEADVTALEAIEEFEHARTTVSACGPRSVVHPANSSRL